MDGVLTNREVVAWNDRGDDRHTGLTALEDRPRPRTSSVRPKYADLFLALFLTPKTAIFFLSLSLSLAPSPVAVVQQRAYYLL